MMQAPPPPPQKRNAPTTSNNLGQDEHPARVIGVHVEFDETGQQMRLNRTNTTMGVMATCLILLVQSPDVCFYLS